MYINLPSAPKAGLQRQQTATPQEVRTASRLDYGQSVNRTQARRRVPGHPSRRQPVLAGPALAGILLYWWDYRLTGHEPLALTSSQNTSIHHETYFTETVPVTCNQNQTVFCLTTLKYYVTNSIQVSNKFSIFVPTEPVSDIDSTKNF